MVPLIVTLLQSELVITTTVIFFSDTWMKKKWGLNLVDLTCEASYAYSVISLTSSLDT